MSMSVVSGIVMTALPDFPGPVASLFAVTLAAASGEQGEHEVGARRVGLVNVSCTSLGDDLTTASANILRNACSLA